jgi:hypothetical protein
VASARDTVVELHFVIADATVGQNVPISRVAGVAEKIRLFSRLGISGNS